MTMFIIFSAICGILFCTGLGLLWRCSLVSKWRMCLQARFWPQEEIHVQGAKVNSIISNNATCYKVDVLYRYTVRGQEYESSCVNPFYDRIGELDGAEDFRDVLLRETPIYCRYNPQQPEQSMLITKVRFRWLGEGIMGLAFLVVSVILLLFMSVFSGVLGTPFVDMIEFVQ